MNTWPALDVRVVDPASGRLETDLILTALDDFGPTGIEEHPARLRVFFPTERSRAAASAALTSAFPPEDLQLTLVDVPDEDWARRSQQDLAPVRVGGLVVARSCGAAAAVDRAAPGDDILVIEPSMGFGTGHHATTRLCLEALQAIDLRGAFVLDLGTGSGILALAARRRGARRALGLDDDPNAIRSANENLARNPAIDRVRFEVGDLRAARLPQAHVVTANLTGALLVQTAPALLAAIQPGGHLILSGLLAEEEGEVLSAFAPAVVTWRASEQGWIGLALRVDRREPPSRIDSGGS